MKLTGAQILIECLKEQGVDTIFGYPGGAVLNIYDELYKNSDRIKHILTAHEQGASHAADGYARASGKVGVCIATSGPGATNLVTGIATAYLDSVPIVAITGNVATSLLGKDSFQEVNITGITKPVTKKNFLVKDVKKLAPTIRQAFTIACSGRPGPVLIDIPKDITAAKCEYRAVNRKERSRLTLPKEDSINKALEMIRESKKPLIFAGGGVITADACSELIEFAEKLSAPVCCSLMGQGAFPCDHPLYTGMIGMHGSYASNMAATNSDLMIAVGVRFSDRGTSDTRHFAKNAKILHLDIDKKEIHKNVKACHHIIGDAKLVLKELLTRSDKKEIPLWTDCVYKWKRDYPIKVDNTKNLSAQYIIKRLGEYTSHDALVTTEVGQHQMWTAQHYGFKNPRSFISSCGLGTMGYGTGASIGAAFARPDKRVIHIAGDGSFRMNMNELATISYYNVPVLIFIINNGTLGMVRQWQNMFYGGRFSHTTLDRGPDFIKLADSFGIQAHRVATIEEFENLLPRIMGSKDPVIIDCRVDIDEKVLPMVAPGEAIENIILE